jgi:hypothetical protein
MFVIRYIGSDKLERITFNPFENVELAKKLNIYFENIFSVYDQENSKYVGGCDEHQKNMRWQSLMESSKFIRCKNLTDLDKIYKELKNDEKNSEFFEDFDFYYVHLENYIKQKYGK